MSTSNSLWGIAVYTCTLTSESKIDALAVHSKVNYYPTVSGGGDQRPVELLTEKLESGEVDIVGSVEDDAFGVVKAAWSDWGIVAGRIVDYEHGYLLFCVIGGPSYSLRVALLCVDEVANCFVSEANYDERKLMLRVLCGKYDGMGEDDVKSTDYAIQSVNEKVEAVKSTMQENIFQALENGQRVGAIAETTERLQEQSEVFRKKSTNLRKRMRCKNAKMTIILTLLIVGILAAALTPIIVKARKDKGNGEE